MTKETCSCGATFDGPTYWCDEFRRGHQHEPELADLQAERDRYEAALEEIGNLLLYLDRDQASPTDTFNGIGQALSTALKETP